MKKIFSAVKLAVALLFIVSFFIACDKDFSNIDSDVIGKDNSNFDTNVELVNITAYSKKIKNMQVNGLPSNLLGVYNDPAYGQTTASIVAQIAPSTNSPDFGDNPEVDSVVITIPYYYRTITDSTYTIGDSLYGSSPIKLSIYKNNYFLRDFNPEDDGNTQYYFSDSENSTTSENVISNGTSSINFDNFKDIDPIYTNTNFKPSANRIALHTYDGDSITSTSYLAPSFRDTLNSTFWQEAIIAKEDDAVLSNTSNFKNYFRGLYIKAEPLSNDGSMILLNTASTSANIVIYYSKDSTVEGERTQSSYTLRFSGNIINTFVNDFDTSLQDGDAINGDELLYLKGSEGSMAIVDLFSGEAEYEGETMSALNAFKKTYRATDENGEYIKDKYNNFILKRLINDAQLTVYEYADLTTGDYGTDYHRYDRIYAYDIKNNLYTIDYYGDPISNTSYPVNSKLVSLSQRDTLQAKYKLRLTEHLKNILLRDSTNTKIGLVLSDNVNVTTTSKLLSETTDNVSGVPMASILMPRGTILHGTNESTAPEERKMKLEIFYTDPNE
ncbi:MAG: DUF4270 domain-containing protein [Aestuariibaculum sp.]